MTKTSEKAADKFNLYPDEVKDMGKSMRVNQESNVHFIDRLIRETADDDRLLRFAYIIQRRCKEAIATADEGDTIGACIEAQMMAREADRVVRNVLGVEHDPPS